MKWTSFFFKGNSYNFAECKFHNRQKLKTPVRVTLYVKARYDDIHTKWEMQPAHHQEFHDAWIITNTRFTSEAIKYANCVGISLLGWSYPKNNSLCQLIDTLGIHPITSLTSLNGKQKRFLIKRKFVLCRDVHKHINDLQELGVSENKLRQIIAEAEGVCAL